MTALFSKKCEYALQALLYMAEFRDAGSLPAEHIANHLNLPREFISKILQSLTKSGIVISQRGKTGGFKLARAPERIKLMEVIADIDGTAIFDACLIGQPDCSPAAPCPVHATWSELRRQLRVLMADTHLGNFIPGQSLHGLTEQVMP